MISFMDVSQGVDQVLMFFSRNPQRSAAALISYERVLPG
jgi:hypothetical protein